MRHRDSVKRDFEARANAVRAARLFAAGAATGWGLDPSDVEIVVGELAANAYVHARSAFTVSLGYADTRLSVEVEDRSSTMPLISRSNPLDAASGRGLLMVEAVSASWGARQTGAGKVVWADLPVHARGGSAPGRRPRRRVGD